MDLHQAADLIACALLAILFGWAVLSPKVMDGVVVKAGLICSCLGFAGRAAIVYAWNGPACDELDALMRATAMIHVGLLVVLIGWYLRSRRNRHKSRRASDWARSGELARGPRG